MDIKTIFIVRKREAKTLFKKLNKMVFYRRQEDFEWHEGEKSVTYFINFNKALIRLIESYMMKLGAWHFYIKVFIRTILEFIVKRVK